RASSTTCSGDSRASPASERMRAGRLDAPGSQRAPSNVAVSDNSFRTTTTSLRRRASDSVRWSRCRLALQPSTPALPGKQNQPARVLHLEVVGEVPGAQAAGLEPDKGVVVAAVR